MPERPTVAVGAIIEDERGRILLVKHVPERGGYWQGKWICPGGKLELGETIEEGIRREVREETQLEIELLRPLPPFDRIVRSGGRVALHIIYVDYRARLAGGQLRPGSDVGEAVWVEPERLPAMWEDLHADTQRLLEIGGVVEKAAPSEPKARSGR